MLVLRQPCPKAVTRIETATGISDLVFIYFFFIFWGFYIFSCTVDKGISEPWRDLKSEVPRGIQRPESMERTEIEKCYSGEFIANLLYAFCKSQTRDTAFIN